MSKGAERKLSTRANLIWNASGSLVYMGAQWITTVLVVRLSTGYDAAGLLALGMAVANVFAPIGYYKIRTFQVSDLDEEYSFSQYLGFRIVTLGLAIAVMLGYGFLTCPQNTLATVFLYGVFALGPIFVDVLHGEEQRELRMDVIGISFMLRGVALLVSFIVGMSYFKSLDVALLLMIVTTYACIVLFDGTAFVRVTGRPLRPEFDARAIRSLFFECLPLVIASFCCWAVPAIPRQVLNEVMGEAALGVYSSVASPILIVQMGVQYVYAPFLTSFAEHFRSGDMRAFMSLMLKITLVIVAMTLVLGVFLAVFGGPLLVLIFGQSIEPYTFLILPLVLCTVLTAYSWFLGDIMVTMRRNRGNLIGFVLSFVIVLIVMYPFIQTFGLNGASFAIIAADMGAVAFFLICVVCAALKMRAD